MVLEQDNSQQEVMEFYLLNILQVAVDYFIVYSQMEEELLIMIIQFIYYRI